MTLVDTLTAWHAAGQPPIGTARPQEPQYYVDAVIGGLLLGKAERPTPDPWIECDTGRVPSVWRKAHRGKRGKAREVGGV